MWKIIRYLLVVFVVSILAVNILEPAIHMKLAGDGAAGNVTLTDFCAQESGSERIRCIDDNEEALLWRLRMIADARESIVLATFDLRADESGKDVMAALYAAAQRGVKVRLLIDGTYQVLFLNNSDLYRTLCAHENVESASYNPVGLKNIYRLNYRMHDKYLIIDDRMYLLGGRNVNDIFLGDYQTGKNVDRDILVYEERPGEGESLGQLQDYFERIWNESCVKKEKTQVSARIREREEQIFAERYAKLQERYDGWMADTYPVNKITLITNRTGAAFKQPDLLETIGALACQGTDVLIQSPYVICSSDMYDVLGRISEKADLRIILNAVERGSNPWGCTDYLNNKEKILACGVTVYELMNEQAVHTKTAVIDDRISIVGSYNLDMRSTYLDTEMMLVIDSERLNAHIRSMAADYERKSIEVLPDGTETVGEEYAARELFGGKKLFYGALRVLIRPLRHLL